MRVVAIVLGFITFVLVWWIYSSNRMNYQLNAKKKELGYKASIVHYGRRYILPLTTFCMMILCLVPWSKAELDKEDSVFMENMPRVATYSADASSSMVQLNFVPVSIEIKIFQLDEPIGTMELSNQIYQVYVVDDELIFVDCLNRAYRSEY